MNLLFRSRVNTASCIDWFKYNCHKSIGTRDFIIVDGGTGMNRVNRIEHGPTNINLIYKRENGSQGIMPVGDFQLQIYTQKIQSLSSKIELKECTIISVENEAYTYPTLNPDMVMMTKMIGVNYNIWAPRGCKVTPSGLNMFVCAALTVKYYQDNPEGLSNSAELLKEFMQSWPLFISYERVDLALRELDLLRKMGLTTLMYPAHIDIAWDNVEGLPHIIRAMKYWVRPYEFFYNELHFRIKDAAVVDKTMQYMKEGGVRVVAGYEGDDNPAVHVAVTWTDEMKKVFANYQTL